MVSLTAAALRFARCGVGRAALLAAACLFPLLHPAFGATAEQFLADGWRTQCEGRAPGTGCSVIVPFQSYDQDGSFALVFDMQSGVMAIVGQPKPLAATVEVDAHPSIRCSGPRYCLFGPRDSAAAARQLAVGSIALIDVATRRGVFHASLSAQGYRASLAKIRAWSYPPAR